MKQCNNYPLTLADIFLIVLEQLAQDEDKKAFPTAFPAWHGVSAARRRHQYPCPYSF